MKRDFFSGNNHTCVCHSGTSDEKFCKFWNCNLWEKNFSSVPDFEPKFSTSFPQKCEKDFKTASCVSRGEIWGKLLFALENKKFYLVFFGFSPQNLSENLLKLQSKCPKDLFQGKKLLETPQNCLSFLRLEANPFWIFGKVFSIKMSKLLFMCPNKRIAEKSLFISYKIGEKYSGISGKKRDLHSVLSKTAFSVWIESLTETPSEFFSVFSRVSHLETSSAEKIFK